MRFSWVMRSTSLANVAALICGSDEPSMMDDSSMSNIKLSA
jgi:hypothetical protein